MKFPKVSEYLQSWTLGLVQMLTIRLMTAGSRGDALLNWKKLAQDMFCDMCAAWLHLKDTVRKTHYGLGSILFIKCTACGAVKRLALGKRNDDGGFDINRQTVVGNIFACIYEW